MWKCISMRRPHSKIGHGLMLSQMGVLAFGFWHKTIYIYISKRNYKIIKTKLRNARIRWELEDNEEMANSLVRYLCTSVYVYMRKLRKLRERESELGCW